VDDVPGCCESGNQLAVMVCLDFFKEKGIGEKWKAERGGLRAPRTRTRSQTTRIAPLQREAK